MLTFEQIKKAYLEDTKKLYLDQNCAICSDDVEEPTRNEEVRLYAYLYKKHNIDAGIYSLCPECDLASKKEWGPSYVLSEQELFVYLLFS